MSKTILWQLDEQSLHLEDRWRDKSSFNIYIDVAKLTLTNNTP